MSSISLCLICKNEEEFLGGCLESAAGVVDEIVVVDTGSTDATIKIAQAAGAHVVEAPWVDFSAARNRALDEATGEWVLILDADEELVVEDPDRLRELASQGEAHAWFIRVIQVVEMSEYVDIDGSPQMFMNRFFKRAGARWVNPVHEQICLPAGAKTAAAAGVDIVHYGYLHDVFVDRAKGEWKKALITQWLKERPDDPMPHFYLANQVRGEGDYQTAAAEYELALPGLIESDAFACGADAFKHLADCYKKTGEDEKVLPLLERAVGTYADCVDLQYAFGCRLLEAGKTTAAIETFRACMQNLEGSPKYAAGLRGAGSWRALERLAAALRRKGRHNKALIALALASALCGESLIGPSDLAMADLTEDIDASLKAIASDPARHLEEVLNWLFSQEPKAPLRLAATAAAENHQGG